MREKSNFYKYCVFIAIFLFILLFQVSSKWGTGKAEQKIQKNPEIVLKLPWGSGSLNAGKYEGDEASPQGPMSFFISPSMEIYILDQVNRRILKIHLIKGTSSVIPINSDTYEDIAVIPDGRIILLDRLVRRAIVVVDEKGKEILSQPVEGEGIPEGGGITAMFLQKDGLYLEYNHEYSVKVLNSKLLPCTRKRISGRPSSQNGRSLLTFKDDSGMVKVKLLDAVSGNDKIQKSFSFGSDLYRIVWLEDDKKGMIHLVVHLLKEGSMSGLPPEEKVLALKLNSQLEKIGSFESPYTITVLEQFKEFQIMDSGEVYQMAFTPEGVILLKWRYEP